MNVTDLLLESTASASAQAPRRQAPANSSASADRAFEQSLNRADQQLARREARVSASTQQDQSRSATPADRRGVGVDADSQSEVQTLDVQPTNEDSAASNQQDKLTAGNPTQPTNSEDDAPSGEVIEAANQEQASQPATVNAVLNQPVEQAAEPVASNTAQQANAQTTADQAASTPVVSEQTQEKSGESKSSQSQSPAAVKVLSAHASDSSALDASTSSFDQQAHQDVKQDSTGAAMGASATQTDATAVVSEEQAASTKQPTLHASEAAPSASSFSAISTADSSAQLRLDASNINTQGANASASASAADSMEDSIEQAALNRVTRGLHNAVRQNGGTTTIRLNPPELGMVRIEMAIQNGAVSATLQSETPSVRILLSQQLAQLRSGLESQGLSVDRLNVQALAQPSSGSFNANQSQQQDQGSLTQQNTPEDGRSRGQYARSDQGASQQDASDRRSDARPKRFIETLLNQTRS